MIEADLATEVRALRESVEALAREVRLQNPKYLTLPKIMKRFGVSRERVRKAFKTGKLNGTECTVRGKPTWRALLEDAEKWARGAK